MIGPRVDAGQKVLLPGLSVVLLQVICHCL